MSIDVAIASTLLAAAYFYAGVGILFAVAFVVRGVAKIDPAAAGAPIGFRLLILPAAALLWPLLLRRWVLGLWPPIEQTAHRAPRGAAHRRGGS